MFNLRPVLFLLGVLLAPMGFFMLLPALFLDSASGAFFFSALFTIFVATSIVLGYREKISFFTIPQAFILSSLVLDHASPLCDPPLSFRPAPSLLHRCFV